MRLQPLNHANYAYLAQPRGEINTLPSQTVPDQAMSIAEILDRFVKKLPLDNIPGTYLDDDLVPVHLERMDAIERTQHARDLKDAIQKHQTRPKLAPQPRALPDEASNPDPEM